MARVNDDEVLLLWRALMAFRSGRRPACKATGRPPRSPCPLYEQCPRWAGPDDYYAVMEETPEQTERYIEITSPEFIAKAFADLGNAFPPPTEAMTSEIPNLIG